MDSGLMGLTIPRSTSPVSVGQTTEQPPFTAVIKSSERVIEWSE
jgi:hypothetical protein